MQFRRRRELRQGLLSMECESLVSTCRPVIRFGCPLFGSRRQKTFVFLFRKEASKAGGCAFAGNSRGYAGLFGTRPIGVPRRAVNIGDSIMCFDEARIETEGLPVLLVCGAVLMLI